MDAVSLPSTVSTPFGEFELFDGVPTVAAVDRLYDLASEHAGQHRLELRPVKAIEIDSAHTVAARG